MGKIPHASPEGRRAHARKCAADRRAQQRWLRDPVAQAEHAEACARHQTTVHQERMERAKAEPGLLADIIRGQVEMLRDRMEQGRREVILNMFRDRLRENWGYRRSAQREWRLLSDQRPELRIREPD